MKLEALCLFTCLLAIPPHAGAATIATDDFSYANGNLAGSNGGTGWSTTWTNTEGTATVADGMANVAATPGQQATRVLSAAQSGTATIWIRFDGRQSTTLAGTTDSYGGLSLYNGGTEQLLIGKAWPGPYEWRAGTGGTMVGPSSPVPTLSLTTVLARVTLNSAGNDSLEVWLNPADMGSEGALGAAQITRSDTDLNFDRIQLRGGSAAGGSESWQFDNLRLGTTLADVAVPEPSATLLGGLALLGFLRRRR